MIVRRIFLLWIGIAASVLAIPAQADAGHDHGTPPVAAVAGGGVPRVEASSDLFELVGVVENGMMTVYLDRYATNEPIANAKIDIEIGTVKGSAHPNADGTYTFSNPVLAQPAQLPVTFGIAVGGEGDLLTAELVISDPNAAVAHAISDPLWKSWWWAAGGALLLGMISIVWLLRRHQRTDESTE